MEHAFTETIKGVLRRHFGAQADEVFERSLLLQYLNLKTRAASRGSKSRSSFANLYALYVLVEDFLAGKFDKKGNYAKYEGAVFTKLFQRQRQLPFGGKLQNHAFNDRLNGEFRKFFPTCEFTPIVRDVQTTRYWINLNLLRVRIGKRTFDLAAAVIAIVDEYIKAKTTAFDAFLQTCLKLKSLTASAPADAEAFSCTSGSSSASVRMGHHPDCNCHSSARAQMAFRSSSTSSRFSPSSEAFALRTSSYSCTRWLLTTAVHSPSRKRRNTSNEAPSRDRKAA